MAFQTTARPFQVRSQLRIGAVSFLNAKPLIYGLESNEDVDLSLEVPSRLLAGLADLRYDVALLPVIDYQRLAGLRLLTAGGIACDGPTLTVRIFSQVPVGQITTLACDTDSHTSVALARIVLAEQFHIRPKIVELNFRRGTEGYHSPETVRLLIGDKVVCDEPKGIAYQIDLGEAWKQLTGLPFVFAAWMAREGVDLGTLPSELEQAKRSGLKHVDELISRHAITRGWPPDIARKYLTEYLKFDIGPRQIEAIRLFHSFAYQHGIIDHSPWGLEMIHTPQEKFTTD